MTPIPNSNRNWKQDNGLTSLTKNNRSSARNARSTVQGAGDDIKVRKQVSNKLNMMKSLTDF